MSQLPAVLDIDVNGSIWVFHRNEHNGYEYVFGTMLMTLYKSKRLWSATIRFRSSNPTEAWKQDGDGVEPMDAIHACLEDALPRISMMSRHCHDFAAFTGITL